jgi:hypothetical protein
MFESISQNTDFAQFKERLAKMSEEEIRESVKNSFGVVATNIAGEKLDIPFEEKEIMIDEEARSRNLW